MAMYCSRWRHKGGSQRTVPTAAAVVDTERRRPCTRLVELINFALNVAKLISSLAASTVVGAAQTNSSQTAGRNRTENVYLVQCNLKDVTAVVIKFSQSCKLCIIY